MMNIRQRWNSIDDFSVKPSIGKHSLADILTITYCPLAPFGAGQPSYSIPLVLDLVTRLRNVLMSYAFNQ